MKQTILSTVLAAAGFAASLAVARADTAPIPKPGDPAPLIAGKDQSGKEWNLKSEVKKHVVLLYFYPKDDTPGCTKEACGLRDRMGDLKKDQVQVLGVSFDDQDSHQKFISKYSLNFPLLADTDGKIADAFGVRMTGRNLAKRVSFLIDRKGVIRHVTDNPSADVHLREMQEAVASLKTASH